MDWYDCFHDEFNMYTFNYVDMKGVGISCFDPKQNRYPIINGIDAAKDSKSKEDAK